MEKTGILELLSYKLRAYRLLLSVHLNCNQAAVCLFREKCLPGQCQRRRIDNASQYTQDDGTYQCIFKIIHK